MFLNFLNGKDESFFLLDDTIILMKKEVGFNSFFAGIVTPATFRHTLAMLINKDGITY